MSNLSVELLSEFRGTDLSQLREAAEAAILAGGGFGWLEVPPRNAMESHWRTVIGSPHVELYVARLDDRIVGSGQLIKAIPKNEAGGFAANLSTLFVAPEARRKGVARALFEAREQSARNQGLTGLNLDVRSTLTAAIALHESCGFERWGTKPRYARIDGHYVGGHYYYKEIG